MRVLVDTNILLRSAQPNHPLNSQATHAVSKLLRQKDAAFFCSQNIAEFWLEADCKGPQSPGRQGL
jgi:predicted nucleic acid-binding protein